MPSDKKQPWKIYIHTKAKHFNFKLKVTTSILPSCKLFPFSINIKDRRYLLRVRSKPQVSFPKIRKSFKSKFLRFLGKFQPRPIKDKAITARPTSNLGHPEANFPENRPTQSSSQEAICIGSVIFGCLVAVVSQSIYQKDLKRVFLCSLIILLYLALVFKKFITRRTRILVISIVAILSCSIVVCLNDISKLREGYFLDCVWKAWKFAASFAQAELPIPPHDVSSHSYKAITYPTPFKLFRNLLKRRKAFKPDYWIRVIFSSFLQYMEAHEGEIYIGCWNF